LFGITPLGRRAFQVVVRRPGEIERHRHAGGPLGDHSAMTYGVSADHHQQPFESSLVLDTVKLSHSFDKAEELPSGLYRKFHPRQFVPADRVWPAARPLA